MSRALVWENVSWRSGEDQYQFEIERGGLFATMIAGDRRLTLPMVVWEGLLDALTANRNTRKRADQQFPPRSRSRWYDGEASELADAFRTGRSIATLARMHNRSEYAIESQLDKMGLISNAERYGPPRAEPGPSTWPPRRAEPDREEDPAGTADSG